jgi:hypothetical protein
MLWIAAIGACLGVIVLWQLAMIAALRLFSTKLPFPVAFHIYPRRQHELLAALEGSRKETFVFHFWFLAVGVSAVRGSYRLRLYRQPVCWPPSIWSELHRGVGSGFRGDDRSLTRLPWAGFMQPGFETAPTGSSKAEDGAGSVVLSSVTSTSARGFPFATRLRKLGNNFVPTGLISLSTNGC